MTRGYLQNEGPTSYRHAGPGICELQAACLTGITDRTIRLSSGKHEPQLVPHFKLDCSEASRSSSLPGNPPR